MRTARSDRRIRDLPAVRVLNHLVLFRSACEPEAALSALAQHLALFGRHWMVRLRHGHATVLRTVREARGVGRRAVARGRRIVRSRGRSRNASSEERVAVVVLAHTAVAARTGCPGAGPRVSGRCSSDAWLVTVRGDLGSSREVRVTNMPDHPVRVKVAIKVVAATAVAAPAEQTDKKDSDQTNNTSSNAASDCSGIATAASGAGRHRRRDEDGRLDGGGNNLAIGSGSHEHRRKNRSRCTRDILGGRARSMLSAPIPDR